MTQIFFNSFSFPADVTVCPFDSTGWLEANLDRSSDTATVSYGCGTVRTIEPDGLLRLSQSDTCVRKQLGQLLTSEPVLELALRQEQEHSGELQSQLERSQSTVVALTNRVVDLQARIAALEGGMQAARFELTFGTPINKE